MKKIIFLILVFNSIVGFGQMQIFVVFKPTINLISQNNSFPYGAITTSDAGLNQIMSNNNARFVEIGGLSSCFNFTSGSNTFGSLNLLNELNNYSNAVEIAYLVGTNSSSFTNFTIDLVNTNEGVYLNTINNVVNTNNNDLNALFQTYGVFSFIKNKVFTCSNCNVENVLNALNNLQSIVTNPQYCSEVFLVNENFEISNYFKIYVSNKNLNITSENNDLKSVSVYNILGKQVINTTTSGNPINVSELSSGIYIVKITENGKSNTLKFVIQ